MPENSLMQGWEHDRVENFRGLLVNAQWTDYRALDRGQGAGDGHEPVHLRAADTELRVMSDGKLSSPSHADVSTYWG
ncbi:hypothetical protein [Streptomyces katrae]|uniref:hypothetical protein n=1 Tax=Streptomyces katrae TaxID=68223 RepID=UPI00131C113A|nr:hypothetical protein [Streptomyces katrae]